MPTLDWIGKRAVVNHHRELPYRLLHCDPALSVLASDAGAGDPASGHLLVEGDNLHALKALLPYYAGRVKCIYIDPPYNTGNEGWVYNDAVNAPEIQKWLGETVGKEAEDLSRHDKWLCMMYPRLALLREFLREDGSIWISIDDNEVSNLRALMDEIFGRQRHIATCVWQKRYSRENREAIGDVHEYLVVYAMNPERFKETRNRVALEDKQRAAYKNPNNDPNGPWQTISMTAQGWRQNQMYDIVAPNGRVHRPPEGRCWSMIEPEYLKLRDAGRVSFSTDGNGVPRVIRYLHEVAGLVPWTWWPHEEVGHTDESRKEIQAIFGTQTAFDTPKPTRLMKRVLQIATNPGDLVLDSFAGSGTTGHAVLALNAEAKAAHTESTEDTEKKQAKDKRDLFSPSVSSVPSVCELPPRRFILCEMEPKIARDITAERLRRVIAGYGDTPGLGGGFRFCTLGEPMLDAEGRFHPDVQWPDLAHHLWFAETGEPLPAGVGRFGPRSPLLGVAADGRAIYLLAGKLPGGPESSTHSAGALGSTLTPETLAALPAHDGPRVVYGEACSLRETTRSRERILFKQIPYQVRQQ